MALICGDHVTAVAAPALLARHGVQAPLAPSAAMTLPLLGYTRRSWIPWLDAATLEPLEPAVVAAFDNAANMVAAAEAGVLPADPRRSACAPRPRRDRALPMPRALAQDSRARRSIARVRDRRLGSGGLPHLPMPLRRCRRRAA